MLRIIFFPLSFLLACNGTSDSPSMGDQSLGAPERMESSAKMDASGMEAAPDAQPQKKVRNGQLRLQVDDARSSAATIRSLTASAKGEIESEFENHYGQTYEINLNVRVPASSLDSVMDAAAGLAIKVENRSVSESDITEYYYDTETRLRNKKELEARYLEILKAAKNVEEMLAIERELNQVRSDIESMETQMRQFDKQVAMSQLSISCVAYQSGMDNFFGQLGQSVQQGWTNLLEFLLMVSRGWAVLLFLGFLWWIIRRWRRSRVKG